MKILLIITSLVFASSSFAIVLNDAVIIDHKSEVYGSDSNGKAIDGHISEHDTPDVENKDDKKSSADDTSKN